ncbi:MAG: DedA family protein [Actinomycetota bacterium]|jgi:membrane protein DedA with SNARE-associated domain|nr:DedA family protein [Actinomycetota bacterium]
MEALINPTNLVSSFGYVAIFVLSVAQSCCVPTSSELTLGFAGALAGTGHLSLPGAILVGASGEILGAYIAWAIGRTAGRSIVDRYGKWVLLTHHDLDRAEAWYARHERWGVFGGRLLPVIRNFVALPAGVAEVPPVRFGVLTAAGSLLWDGAMAGIGYGLGSRWHAIIHAFGDAGYVLGALAVVAVVVLVVHRWRSYGAQVSAAHAAAAATTGTLLGADPVGGGSASPATGTVAEAATTAVRGAEVANPREEITALVKRLAAPGAGVGERTGVAANERLTAAAGAVLFVLIFVEGLTLVRIGSMMAMHVIVGLILVPPVLVKLASTGWRFARYYTDHPEYLRKGPPRRLLRALAPVLVLSTVVLFASGIALVVIHDPNGWLYVVHRYDFLVWFAVLAVHVLTYMWQVPGVVRRDVSRRPLYRRTSPRGRLLRLWLVWGSVVAGVALAVILWPSISGQVHTFFHVHRAAATLRRPRIGSR